MKNIMIIVTVGIVMTGCGLAASKTIQSSSKGERKTITVLDKGVKRQIPVPGNSSSKIQTSNKTSDIKNGVLVAFKDSSIANISEFETRYGLKLKSKMAIGYYIFENRSSRGDSQIIADIISNEANIKTVKPNWRMRNKIR